MKLLTYRPPQANFGHFGVLLSNNHVLDITALKDCRLPSTLLACIEGGEDKLLSVRGAVNDAEGALKRGEMPTHVHDLDMVTLEPPIRPGKIMAVGRNYAEHIAECHGGAYGRLSGFIKLTSSIVGHRADITRPVWTQSLDYENELAIVIGTKCNDVASQDAFDQVFGYTIMNDLSCRDIIELIERKEGNVCIGKNFPTGAPFGPWIVTKDEIPDPHNLRILTRVNGEIRQDGNTRSQIYRIPAQIEWWSRAGFEPGDVISSGTPAGTGLSHKDQGNWYLQPGDEIECEIEGIGVLANKVMKPKQLSPTTSTL